MHHRHLLHEHMHRVSINMCITSLFEKHCTVVARPCHLRLQTKQRVSKIVRKILYQFISPYFPLASASKTLCKGFPLLVAFDYSYGLILNRWWSYHLTNNPIVLLPPSNSRTSERTTSLFLYLVLGISNLGTRFFLRGVGCDAPGF
jgi:hypothetical protein